MEALKAMNPRQILGSSPTTQQQNVNVEAEKRRELEVVARFDDDKKVLSPKEIAERPKNKELGASSSKLELEDFEMIKTLGTGKRSAQPLQRQY